jgi:hypothetical protein
MGISRSLFGQAFTLPLLSRVAVDLEHAQSLFRVRIAEAEGIKTCSQYHCLSHATINSAGKTVFRKATPCDREEPQTI